MGNFGEEEEKLVTIRKKAVNTIVDSGIVAAGKARCGSVNEFPHQKHEFPHHLARWPPSCISIDKIASNSIFSSLLPSRTKRKHFFFFVSFSCLSVLFVQYFGLSASFLFSAVNHFICDTYTRSRTCLILCVRVSCVCVYIEPKTVVNVVLIQISKFSFMFFYSVMFCVPLQMPFKRLNRKWQLCIFSCRLSTLVLVRICVPSACGADLLYVSFSSVIHIPFSCCVQCSFISFIYMRVCVGGFCVFASD